MGESLINDVNCDLIKTFTDPSNSMIVEDVINVNDWINKTDWVNKTRLRCTTKL